MATLADALWARALAHAGLQGVLGNPPRLYPVSAVPQDVVVPYASYALISAPRAHLMGADQEAQPRVQIDVFAATPKAARIVNAQVVACFDRWAGIFAGVTVLGSVCESDGVDVEREEVTLLARVTSEFVVTYAL